MMCSAEAAAASRVTHSPKPKPALPPKPAPRPPKDNVARPAVAMSTASQVDRGMRSRSRPAVKMGVSTTYVPVMKPDREASVCARPTVCRFCATAYRTPSPMPIFSSRLPRANNERQNTTTMTAAAIVKRTARKSVGGSTRTTSRIRKKVEPHTAVVPPSNKVARRRESAEVTGVGASDDGKRDGRAHWCWCSRRDRLEPDRAEETTGDPVDLHFEAQTLEDGTRLALLLAKNIWDHHELRPLGDDQGDLVPLEERSGCRGLADHRSLGDGVAPVLFGGVDLELGIAQCLERLVGRLVCPVQDSDRLTAFADDEGDGRAALDGGVRGGRRRDDLTLRHGLTERLADLAEGESGFDQTLFCLGLGTPDQLRHGIALRSLRHGHLDRGSPTDLAP